ncbi:MAG TPA: thermonuclease family protein [Candidatus Binatia bacterium]|nr:thermonuclease family protein [Candidatus Binatia bacterium]
MRNSRYFRRHKLKFAVFIVVALAVVATQSGWLNSGVKSAQQNQPGLYAIDHFIDGDTIAVNMNGSVETIRMIGVDTPETHRPKTPVQCYGPVAANYTKSLIGSNRVRLQADNLDTNRDRYGRLLRYVYLPDGRLVEDQLIARGYGFAYTLFPFEKKPQFVAKQAAAKQANVGLWGACSVTVDSSGREQTNAISTN